MENIFIDEFEEVVLYKRPTPFSREDIFKVAPANGDEFDPYIGVALAYCYECFGSKAEFTRAVDELRKKCKNARRERLYTLDDGQKFKVEEDEHGWI